jgi:hypothetical protein
MISEKNPFDMFLWPSVGVPINKALSNPELKVSQAVSGKSRHE